MRNIRLMGVLIVMVLTGCQTLGGGSEESGASGTGAGSTSLGASTQGLPGSGEERAYEVQVQGTGKGQNGAGPEGGGFLARRTLYFDFDSAQVRSEDIPVIQAHAQYLLNHPQARVTLEGHTDERGSREYNVALGEERAKAVAKLLEVNGVSQRQIQVISYGEEKPVALGHDEAAWQQNRRVEIVYGGR